MSYALRDYQQFSYDQIFGALQQARSTLLVLPTGTGKTIIFGAVARVRGGQGPKHGACLSSLNEFMADLKTYERGGK